MAKRRIAVLGGGMGSLSAVFALTARPDWQDELDITVYQVGWRLGGKAASGRVHAENDRSLEHGYHVLLGFYDNAFATMREVYRERGRPSDAPLADFCALTPEEEHASPRRFAVRRHYTCQIAQTFAGKTHYLPFNVPPNALVPGDGASVDPFTALSLGFDTLFNAATGRLFAVQTEAGTPAESSRPSLLSWMHDELGHLAHAVETDVDRWLSSPLPLHVAHAIWHEILSWRALGREVRAIERLIVHLIKAHMRRLWEKVQPHLHDDWPTYRDWIIQDTLSSTICGILADEVLTRGFTHLNDVNYLDWWMGHSAVPEGAAVTAQSSLGQFPYDLVFGYRDGDTKSPDMEAGTMLMGLFHFMLAYKGAPEWMPQAGFGEVLVAPLYEVLKARGVRFEFFSRVRSVKLDDSKRSVDRIVVERQTTLKHGEYQPLYDVNGLACWPSLPFYDQLVEGDELKARGINLESWWTDWQGQTVELQRARDFDDVLIGISIAALPTICADLVETSPAWRAMVTNVKTNRPLIVQTWQTRSIAELGFPYGVINGDIGTQPINLLTSMDQILAYETYTLANAPRSLIYYSGVMPDDPNQPPAPNPAYPPAQQNALREASIAFLERYAQVYLPNAIVNGTLDWSIFASPANPGAQGRARFDAQYWRVNIDPSERYVLSVTGSSQYRLSAGGSGFDNVFITGDWIETGLNAGCMEATVTSGLEAARAIAAARPFILRGERDWRTPAAAAHSLAAGLTLDPTR